MSAAVRPRKAWAIVDRRGAIQLDMVVASKAEAWGLLCDSNCNLDTIEDCKNNGYRCVRVEVRGAKQPTGSEK